MPSPRWDRGDAGVHYRVYERGRLYYTEASGVHELHGRILVKYLQVGGHRAFGVPATDETVTPDGVGRFNYFAGTSATGDGSIYWTPDTGAHSVWGPVFDHWAASG